ncbi:MAG: sulfatase-like hydrolase/transferase, partial [Bacilli bacterium]|nr:sulfatase-like hydrolase/transferase [Bacilli bacterium]
SFFFKTHKKRFIYLVSMLAFHSLVCVIDAVYYTYYASFSSVSEISSLGQVKTVKEAFFEHLHPIQFIYFLAPIVFFIIYKRIKKKLPDIKKGKKYLRKKFWKTLLVGLIISSPSFITANRNDYSRLYKQWNRPYVVNRFGLSIYHAMDLYNYVASNISSVFGLDNALFETKDFYDSNKDYKETNKYTGMFEGYNIIFVHMEGIQSFLFNLKFNDEYVIPTVRELANEGMYFDNFYPQIALGTSSDTEFSILTSLLPSNSGTVFGNFYNHKYVSLMNELKKNNYYTFSMHGNDITMWNRNNAHPYLGYSNFYFSDKYTWTEEEFLNLGITDFAFFKQSIPYLEDIEKNNPNYAGTIITLSNHSPFIFLDKYKEYDLTKDYTYYNEKKGKEEKLTTDYLTGTSIGNYIISSHNADLALKDFVKMINNSDYFNNTIFIFYGDHDPRLAIEQYNYFYNYNPITKELLNNDEEKYYDYNDSNHIKNRSTPLIIWSKNENVRNLIKGRVSYPTSMIDIMPTIGNMLNITNPYALGHDIFNIKDNNIVVFPNGDFITKDYIYVCSKDLIYDFKTNTLIDKKDLDMEQIEKYKEYATKRITISNNIIHYDLIKILEKNKVN